MSDPTGHIPPDVFTGVVTVGIAVVAGAVVLAVALPVALVLGLVDWVCTSRREDSTVWFWGDLTDE